MNLQHEVRSKYVCMYPCRRMIFTAQRTPSSTLLVIFPSDSVRGNELFSNSIVWWCSFDWLLRDVCIFPCLSMFDQQDMATATAVLPNLDHLSMVDYNHIYEPAEDTFLACDALLQERGFLETLRPMIVMEIGSGSGTMLYYPYRCIYPPNQPLIHILLLKVVS